MRIAALALVLAAVMSLPAFAYDPAKHPTPNPQGPAYEQGRIQVHQGNWAGAVSLFEKVVAENPKDYKAFTLLGYSLRHMGRIKEAIVAYDRAVALNPSYAEVREYRGIAHALSGDREAAMRDYRALIQMGSPLAEDLKAAIDQIRS